MLCSSVVIGGSLSDIHLDNIYAMLKDVSNNIEKDRHNTIFAFTDAIVQAGLVDAAIRKISIVIETS